MAFLLLLKQHSTPLSLPLPPNTRKQIGRRGTAAAFLEGQGSWEKREVKTPARSSPSPLRATRSGRGAERSPPNLEMPDKAAAWQRIRTIKSFN